MASLLPCGRLVRTTEALTVTGSSPNLPACGLTCSHFLLDSISKSIVLNPWRESLKLFWSVLGSKGRLRLSTSMVGRSTSMVTATTRSPPLLEIVTSCLYLSGLRPRRSTLKLTTEDLVVVAIPSVSVGINQPSGTAIRQLICPVPTFLMVISRLVLSEPKSSAFSETSISGFSDTSIETPTSILPPLEVMVNTCLWLPGFFPSRLAVNLTTVGVFRVSPLILSTVIQFSGVLICHFKAPVPRFSIVISKVALSNPNVTVSGSTKRAGASSTLMVTVIFLVPPLEVKAKSSSCGLGSRPSRLISISKVSGTSRVDVPFNFSSLIHCSLGTATLQFKVPVPSFLIVSTILFLS